MDPKDGSKSYSQKLAEAFNKRIDYLKSYPKLGKATSIKTVRVTVCGHFSIFYTESQNTIYIIGLYDTRRDPKEIMSEIKKELKK